METLILYLIKSSGLLAAFFLTYHFLLRKDTFFNMNRWFLLGGLVISVLLPLCFISKTVIVEKPAVTLSQLMEMAKSRATVQPVTNESVVQVQESFDWSQLLPLAYSLIAAVLLAHILINLWSLYRLLRKREIIRRGNFSLVDLKENIAPFSFFQYIVFNSSLYTQSELQSILNHEQVHSREKHSFDILFARLFCIFFWFNPFIWMYRKAIVQNLEYIADRNAIAVTQDRKAYQIALLKVVGQQNCLSVTNHFYQSLIKKRIVMLNKSKSKNRNLVKYAIIIPLLAAFMFYFQVKVIAQTKDPDVVQDEKLTSGDFTIVIDKNSTDADMKAETERVKKEYDVTVKISKVRRNKDGEITRIKITYKDKNGQTGTTEFNSDKPINPISLTKNDEGIAFHSGSSDNLSAAYGNAYVLSLQDSDDEAPEAPEAPELPEAPEQPEETEAPEAPEPPAIPNAPHSVSKSKTISITQNGNDDPVIIINGKKVEGDTKKALAALDPDMIGSINVFKDPDIVKAFGGNDNGAIFINMKENDKLVREAMKQAREQLKIARIQIEKSKPDMERARLQLQRNRPEMEQAKQEMLRAKEELLRVKAEMEKAKAELDKTREELKKQK